MKKIWNFVYIQVTHFKTPIILTTIFFSENEAYVELKTEIAAIKEHLFEETELMRLMESIAVSLQHIDALLTSYEIDPTTTDLNVLSDHLRSDYDRLEMLNEKTSLSKVKREKYSVKLEYLNALYADLLLRLQKLQKGCDISVQVISQAFACLLHSVSNVHFRSKKLKSMKTLGK